VEVDETRKFAVDHYRTSELVRKLIVRCQPHLINDLCLSLEAAMKAISYLAATLLMLASSPPAISQTQADPARIEAERQARAQRELAEAAERAKREAAEAKDREARAMEKQLRDAAEAAERQKSQRQPRR
jgi:hypothetical protein